MTSDSFWQNFQFTVCNIYFFPWIHSWFSLYVWFPAAGKLCGHVFVCFIIWILTTFPTWGFLSFFDLCFLKVFINVRKFLYTVSFSIYYSFTFLFRVTIPGILDCFDIILILTDFMFCSFPIFWCVYLCLHYSYWPIVKTTDSFLCYVEYENNP